jgi:hypothetical protein
MCQLFRHLYPDPGMPGILHNPHAGLLNRLKGLQIGHIPLTNPVPVSREVSSGRIPYPISPPTVDMLKDVRENSIRCQRIFSNDASGAVAPVPGAKASSPSYDSVPVPVPVAGITAAESSLPTANVVRSAESLHLEVYDAYAAGDLYRAIKLCSAVEMAPDATPALKAKALYNRGVLHGERGVGGGTGGLHAGDRRAAQGAPVEAVAQAHINRGVLHRAAGASGEQELADCTPGSSRGAAGVQVEQVAKALLNRGVLYGQQGRPAEELADYTRVIEGCPGHRWSRWRGAAQPGRTARAAGRPAEELAGYTRVIEGLPGHRWSRWPRRSATGGCCMEYGGVQAEELADYMRVIERGCPGAGGAGGQGAGQPGRTARAAGASRRRNWRTTRG